MIVADANLYTTRDPSAWTIRDWIDVAASGLSTRNTKCAAILRNQLTNLRFGITVASDALAVPDNQLDTLAADNQILGFSGDGMRPLGLNITLSNNRIVDSYASIADGDPNHDDAIQGFALGGAVYDHVLIEGTYVQETTDTTRPFNAELQGISVFDGLYTNLIVRRNVVLVGAYHGISIFGPKDSLIEHNTVIGINPAHQLRISAPPQKDGTPPVNTTVRNNLANVMILDPAVTSASNPTLATTDAPANFVQFELAASHFDLLLLPTSPLFGTDVGAY